MEFEAMQPTEAQTERFYKWIDKVISDVAWTDEPKEIYIRKKLGEAFKLGWSMCEDRQTLENPT